MGSNPIGDACGTVRKPEKRRSSNLRESSVGSTPTRVTFSRVGWALARPSGRNPPAFGPCRFNSCPTHLIWLVRLSVQDTGLPSRKGGFDSRTGHWVEVCFVHGQVVQLVDTRRSERRALRGVGVQVSPWSLCLILTQADQCPAEPHKLCASGATPEPASCLQPSTQTLAKRSGREPDDFASSTLASATLFGRVVQRYDA